MSKTVYLVLTEYPHEGQIYHAICSTEERAQRGMSLYPGSTIEEFFLDEFDHDIEDGLFCFEVKMRRDGTVISCKQGQLNEPYYTLLQKYSRNYAVFARVHARSGVHAVELVEQIRQTMIESGEWPEGISRDK